MMNYRRLGRTNITVSVIGFGTAQFRLVPERQAIETLLRGFELGINLVHTAPDYEGADDLIARALKETSQRVVVCSQGYGSMDQFERHFEEMCRKLDEERLDLFGIACIEDRELAGENVWGPGGMVEFLQLMKQAGRLSSSFCTTHSSPDGIKRLIESDLFDALMIPYNVLGFHLLSECFPPLDEDPKTDPFDLTALRWRKEQGFESLTRNKEEIFPLARQHDIGLMIMKPLAGGLLCQGKAFPPRLRIAPEAATITAGEALRLILRNPEVACVVPGTASPEEAEENALAGHGSLTSIEEHAESLESNVRLLDTALCSRCGQCANSCSQGLWIPWLFRSGYTHIYNNDMFVWNQTELDYFSLDPSKQSTCSTCPEVTCYCPSGIDIPTGLAQIHEDMVGLAEQDLVPSNSWLTTGEALVGAVPTGLRPCAAAVHRYYRVLKAHFPLLLRPFAVASAWLFHRRRNRRWSAHVLTRDLPAVIQPGVKAVCRLFLENTGRQPWYTDEDGSTVLRVYLEGELQQEVRLRQRVDPNQRGHFSFELKAPQRHGSYRLSLDLIDNITPKSCKSTFRLLCTTLLVKDQV
jgi:predicted aldo/keto reductase-like oxidoreductase